MFLVWLSLFLDDIAIYNSEENGLLLPTGPHQLHGVQIPTRVAT